MLDHDGRRLGTRGSHYWKERMTEVDLSEDGVCVDDVYIAELDDDVDDCVDAEDAVLYGLCDEETGEPDSHALEVSVVGSPVVTDDARRSGPAEQDHQSQGGPG